MKVSEFNYYVEDKAREALNATEPACKTLHCCDGILSDGRKLEVKNLSGSRASLGGMATLEGKTSIREAVEGYCSADVYAVYVGSKESYEPENLLIMEREEAIEWFYQRVTLDRMSTKKGGHPILRISKLFRTMRATQKFIDAGYVM